MTDDMKQKLLAELRATDAKAYGLRRALGVSANGPDDVLWTNCIDGFETYLGVIGDGYGGACLILGKGNFPEDYLTLDERRCETEAEALELAEMLDNENDEKVWDETFKRDRAEA